MLSRIEKIYSKGSEVKAEISVFPGKPRFSGELSEGVPAEYLWTEGLSSCIAIGLVYKKFKTIKKFELYHSNSEHYFTHESPTLLQAVDAFLDGIEDTENVQIFLGYNSNYYYYYDEDIRRGKANFDNEQMIVYDLINARCLQAGKNCVPLENYEVIEGDDTFFITRGGRVGSVRRACAHSLKTIGELLRTEADELENLTPILEILNVSKDELSTSILAEIKRLASELLLNESMDLNQNEQLICTKILSWDYVTNSPFRYLAEKKLYDILDVIELFKHDNPGCSMVRLDKIYQLVDISLQSERLHLLEYQHIEIQIRELCKEEVKMKFNFFEPRAFNIEASDIVADILGILNTRTEINSSWINRKCDNLNLRHSC
jgi:hypothetical protein